MTLVIFSISPEAMDINLNNLFHCCIHKEIQVNIEKIIKPMICRKINPNPLDFNLVYNDQLIEIVDYFKCSFGQQPFV